MDPVTRVLSVLVLTMNRVDEMQVEAVAQTVSFVLVGLLPTRVCLLSVSPVCLAWLSPFARVCLSSADDVPACQRLVQRRVLCVLPLSLCLCCSLFTCEAPQCASLLCFLLCFHVPPSSAPCK